jgi:hypothetical protein
MAATTSLIIAGASAAASAGQAIAANKRRKEADFAAKDAAAKLRNISETDYSAGLQVPTMGYDLAQEGVQQQVATGVEALQGAGAAGVIGGLPTLTQQSNQANLELGADLQNQEYQRDLMRAQTRQQIEGRKVGREVGIATGELEGAQLAASENRQIANQAIGAGLGALQLGYGQYLEGKPLYDAQRSAPDLSGINRMGLKTTVPAAPKPTFSPAAGLMTPSGVAGGQKPLTAFNMKMNPDGTFSPIF